MRHKTWMFVSLSAAALTMAWAMGCTTSDEDPDTGPGTGGSAGGGYTPPTNGVAMSEGDACESLRGAFDKHASRLGCTYTMPICPDYIRSSGAPVCSEYDEGTVTGCADYYATFTSCGDFEMHPCHIHNIQDSAPNGCDAVDAGPDVDTDAEADAEVDAEVDATADAEADAEVDATTDAEVDAEADADVDGGAADATTD